MISLPRSFPSSFRWHRHVMQVETNVAKIPPVTPAATIPKSSATVRFASTLMVISAGSPARIARVVGDIEAEHQIGQIA